MTDRLCGYCRQTGHTMPKCDLRNNQILTIRRHVGRERLELARALIRSGFGAGALLQSYDWECGEDTTMIIVDPNQSVTDYHNSCWETRNVTYSKRVRITLTSTLGASDDGLPEGVYMRLADTFYVQARPLENVSRETACCLRIVDLEGLNRKPPAHYYSWNRYAKLLVPSYDGEINMDILNATFRLPPRLGGSTVKPLFD